MDADRFDSLTRALTAAGSRRNALAPALGGALGLLGLVHLDGTVAGGTFKPGCQTCKKGKCRKTSHGKTCKTGKCTAKPFGTPRSGGTCQSGTCIAAASPAPPCVPESQAAACVGAACGTARNNTCGQAVACTCPTDQACLGQGSCARPCVNGGQCSG